MRGGIEIASSPLPQDRRWLGLRGACALVWAVELFWVQAQAFPADPWVRYPLLFQTVRFVLDLSMAVMILALLRRRFVAPFLVLNALFLMGVGAYSSYFYRPLMPASIISQWSEGMSITTHLSELIPLRLVGVVAMGFVVKLLLLIASGSLPVWRAFRWWVAGVGLVLYIGLVAVMQFTSSRLDPKGDMGRVVYTYGYVLPWIADTIGVVGLGAVAERASVYASAHHYDRLTSLEKPLKITSNILVLQLETIGTHAVFATHEGQPIMPFLKGLTEQALYFRIQAFHVNGSCDMDYAATTFMEPYPGSSPYRVPLVTATNSMPTFMKRYGYRTFVLHGNTQIFYHRGPAMERMGFDKILFKEQLASQRLESSILGVRDAALFRCVADILRTQKRVYVFAITLDTHAPFTSILSQEQELFNPPTSPAERYLNSARYLDRCLTELVATIPIGTTVLLYGDHTASLKEEVFESDVKLGREYVPCLIYQKGSDLSLQQATRGQAIATNGIFNLLDVLAYLRASITVSTTNAVSNKANQ